MSLLNLIYVTASQALQFKFRAKYDSKPEYDNFECIAALDASILFRQIDSITANIKRIKLGYTLNEMLVLEKLLASYQG